MSNVPWWGRPAVAFDTETLGLKPGAGVVEIAWQFLPEGLGVEPPASERASFVLHQPEEKVAAGASALAVNRITREEIAAGVDPAAAYELFVSALDRAGVVYAHNLKFDRAHVEAEHPGTAWPALSVCTVELAHACGRFRGWSLGNVAAQAGVPANGTLHRAAADADLCRRVAANIVTRGFLVAATDQEVTQALAASRQFIADWYAHRT